MRNYENYGINESLLNTDINVQEYFTPDSLLGFFVTDIMFKKRGTKKQRRKTTVSLYRLEGDGISVEPRVLGSDRWTCE